MGFIDEQQCVFSDLVKVGKVREEQRMVCDHQAMLAQCITYCDRIFREPLVWCLQFSVQPLRKGYEIKTQTTPTIIDKEGWYIDGIHTSRLPDLRLFAPRDKP